MIIMIMISRRCIVESDRQRNFYSSVKISGERSLSHPGGMESSEDRVEDRLRQTIKTEWAVDGVRV